MARLVASLRSSRDGASREERELFERPDREDRELGVRSFTV
jgi:hypothetical protein